MATPKYSIYGAAEASKIENAIVLILLILIVFFVAGGVPAVKGSQLRPFNPNGWAAVLATTGTIYVSFIGFAVITTATAEIENPARNLPLAMVTAVLVPTVLYVLVMIVSTGILSAEQLQGSRVPVAVVASEYAGSLGAIAMVGGAALATISSANASILAAGRVSYAMGRTQLRTDWLAKIHDRFGTPSRAIILTGIGIIALVVLGVGINVLAEVASFVYLLTYGLVHVAVIQLRRHDDAYAPEFQMPEVLFSAVPVIGMIATLAIMSQMNPVVIAGGVLIVVVATIWYYFYVRQISD